MHAYKYPDINLVFYFISTVSFNDGSVIILGSIQDTFGVNNSVLLKIDSSFNVLWWKNYRPLSYSDVNSVMMKLSDTTVLVGCEHSNELLDPYSIISETKLMVIDTAGNVLLTWYDPNDSTFTPNGLLKTLDGGIAYCGQRMIQMNGPHGGTPLTYGTITKLDSNFNLVWRTFFSTNQLYSNEFYQLRQLPDGSLIAAGEGVGYVAATGADENTGWFVKVSASGDSIWSRMYVGVSGATNTNSINDFQLLPDGSIIGCGEADDDAAPQYNQQAWLIRLDSMGCLIPGCDTLTATGIAPVAANGNHTGMVLYPNPTSGIEYILIKTDAPNPQLAFKVYTAAGQLLTTQAAAAPDITYLLHTAAYAPGMYIVQLLNNDEVITTQRFVKQ